MPGFRRVLGPELLPPPPSIWICSAGTAGGLPPGKPPYSPAP